MRVRHSQPCCVAEKGRPAPSRLSEAKEGDVKRALVTLLACLRGWLRRLCCGLPVFYISSTEMRMRNVSLGPSDHGCMLSWVEVSSRDRFGVEHSFVSQGTVDT